MSLLWLTKSYKRCSLFPCTSLLHFLCFHPLLTSFQLHWPSCCSSTCSTLGPLYLLLPLPGSLLLFLFIMPWLECHPREPSPDTASLYALPPCCSLAEWPTFTECSLHARHAKHDFFKPSQQPCDVAALLSPSNR